MSSLTPPNINDGYAPYFYLPYMATLYGYQNGIHRWLRVTDSEESVVQTFSMGSEVTDVVHCYGLSSYLTYLTFGFTPFIEVAMSGLRTGVDVRADAKYLLTQACARSYESRIMTLMRLEKRKQASLLTRNSPQAKELSNELVGCLLLWEQLMNSGVIRPSGCILTKDAPGGSSLGIMRRRWIERKYEELAERSKSSNFINIPYKMTSEMRTMFLSGYGVRV